MKNWMKWAAVAAVALVAVPVMGLSMAPTKTNAKTPIKPAGKVTPVGNVSKSKKTTLAAKPVVKNTKNMSPRPASVRLGKNPLPAKSSVATRTKGQGHVTTPAHATPSNSKLNAKNKPVLVSRTPVRPTTLHTGPAKLPTPKSTLSKAMEKTQTPSSPAKSKPTNGMARIEMN